MSILYKKTIRDSTGKETEVEVHKTYKATGNRISKKKLKDLKIPPPLYAENFKDKVNGEYIYCRICRIPGCGGWTEDLSARKCPECGFKGLDLIRRTKWGNYLLDMELVKKSNRKRKKSSGMDSLLIRRIKEATLKNIEAKEEALIRSGEAGLPLSLMFEQSGMSFLEMCRRVVDGIACSESGSKVQLEWVELQNKIMLDWEKVKRKGVVTTEIQIPRGEILKTIKVVLKEILEELSLEKTYSGKTILDMFMDEKITNKIYDRLIKNLDISSSTNKKITEV